MLHETTPTAHNGQRWTLAVTLALVLQIVALGYWAGSLSAKVDALTRAVTELSLDLRAHINAPSR